MGPYSRQHAHNAPRTQTGYLKQRRQAMALGTTALCIHLCLISSSKLVKNVRGDLVAVDILELRRVDLGRRVAGGGAVAEDLDEGLELLRPDEALVLGWGWQPRGRRSP